MEQSARTAGKRERCAASCCLRRAACRGTSRQELAPSGGTSCSHRLPHSACADDRFQRCHSPPMGAGSSEFRRAGEPIPANGLAVAATACIWSSRCWRGPLAKGTSGVWRVSSWSSCRFLQCAVAPVGGLRPRALWRGAGRSNRDLWNTTSRAVEYGPPWDLVRRPPRNPVPLPRSNASPVPLGTPA